MAENNSSDLQRGRLLAEVELYESLSLERAPRAFTLFHSVLELFAETIGVKMHELYEKLGIKIINEHGTLVDINDKKILIDFKLRTREHRPLPDTAILDVRNKLNAEDAAALNLVLEAKIRDIRAFYDSFMYNYGHLFEAQLMTRPVEIVKSLKVDQHMRFYLDPMGNCVYTRIAMSS